MKVAILGSGNGGCAAAFDWAYHGHDVALWDVPQFGRNIEAIAHQGAIHSEGAVSGTVAIPYAGFDLDRAVAGADLVLVVGPAYSTAPVGEVLRDHLAPGQAVVVMPGSCLGSVALKRALGAPLRSADPLVGETSTLPYGVRVESPGRVHLFHKLYGGLWVAALPGTETDRLLELLLPVYPGMRAAASILQTSLQNGNPVIHPAVSLCNASRIEDTHGAFRFYDDGVTEGSGRVMKAVDEERIAIGAKLGVEIMPDPELGVLQGYMNEASYYEGFVHAPGFTGIRAQEHLNHRYFNEDVGYGLVFFAELGRQIGVPTPTMDAIVWLVSKIMERDYRGEKARTLESVGLGDLSLDELRRL